MSSASVTYNFTNGTTADAEQVDTNFADLVSFANSHLVHSHDLATVGCAVRRVANQSVNDSTATAISWDTEDEDTDGFFAPTSTTVTIPSGKDGLYVATISLVPGTTINNRMLLDVKPAAGSSSLPTGQTTQIRNEGNTPTTRGSATVLMRLVGGNNFTVEVFHTHGSAQNFTASMNVYRWPRM